MKIEKGDLLQIHKKWTEGLKEFYPFFKNNQIQSLRYAEGLSHIDYIINIDIQNKLENILSDYDLSKSFIILDHENPVMCSLILNNYFNIKPIFVMNNFIFHSHSFINNEDYLNQLYNASLILNDNSNPITYAFVTYTKRYKEYYGDNFNSSQFFMNEYEVGDFDLPDEKFIKKYSSFKDIIYISDNEFTKEDMDSHLHYYEKHDFSVKRHFTHK